MRADNLSRRAFLASSGTVLASLTFSLASGPAAAFAEEGNDVGSDKGGSRIVIVHTNDVHCNLSNSKTKLGYAKLVDYVADQRSTYGTGNVSLVDAGDNIQGLVMGSLTKGEYPARAVAACHYDVMAVGNHEYDYGIDQFDILRSTENTTAVSCNYLDVSGNRILPAYKSIDYTVGDASVRVAYVGVTTPSTLTSSMPTNFQDDDGNYIYDFCGDATGEKLYGAVQTAVDQARNVDGADYVVLLAHLGQSGSVDRWRSDALVANTTGIDVVVDAHSHEQYVQTVKNRAGDDVVITQTGTQFAAFGRVEIDPASGVATAQLTATGVTAELISSWDGEDSEVAALVAELQAELEKITSRKVCTSEVKLLCNDEDPLADRPIRLRETNLGDFCADAALYYACGKGQQVDVALVNGGGIRADIEPGDVTYGNFIAVHPYCNQICSLPVSGQHLLNMLEIAYSKLPSEGGCFVQVSEGLEVVVRIDVPTPVVISEDGTKVEKIEGTRRVASAKLYGKDIDPAGTYVVAASEYYLVNGGDNMPIPDNAQDAELVGLDVDALIEYANVYLKGTIGAGYENQDGVGRIKIVDTWTPEDEDGEDGGTPDGGGAADGAGDGDGAGDANDTRGGGSVPATGEDCAAAVAAAAALGAGALLAAGGFATSGEE